MNDRIQVNPEMTTAWTFGEGGLAMFQIPDFERNMVALLIRMMPDADPNRIGTDMSEQQVEQIASDVMMPSLMLIGTDPEALDRLAGSLTDLANHWREHLAKAS